MENGITGREAEKRPANDICFAYNEIALIDVFGQESEELQTESKALFTSFDALYHLATSPSGENSSFVENYNEYINDIEAHNSLLETYLK